MATDTHTHTQSIGSRGRVEPRTRERRRERRGGGTREREEVELRGERCHGTNQESAIRTAQEQQTTAGAHRTLRTRESRSERGKREIRRRVWHRVGRETAGAHTSGTAA